MHTAHVSKDVDLLKRMVDEAPEFPSGKTSESFVLARFEILEDLGRLEEALSLFQRFRKIQSTGLEKLWRQCLHLLLREGRIDTMMSYFWDMKAAGGALDDSHWSAVLAGIVQSKNLVILNQIAAEIPEYYPSEHFVCSKMQALQLLKRHGEALQLFSRFRDEGLATAELPWNVAISILGDGGSLQEVIDLLQSMKGGVEPGVVTWLTAFGATKSSNDLVSMSQINNLSPEFLLDESFVTAKAALLSRLGRHKEGLALLEKLHSSGIEFGPVAWNVKSYLLYRMGRFEEVLQVLETMKSLKIPIDESAYISVLLAAWQDPQARRRIVFEARAAHPDAVDPRFWTLVFRSLKSIGETKEAEVVLGEMEERGIQLDEKMEM